MFSQGKLSDAIRYTSRYKWCASRPPSPGPRPRADNRLISASKPQEISMAPGKYHMFVISNAPGILARDRPGFTEWNISLENGKSVHKPPFRSQKGKPD